MVSETKDKKEENENDKDFFTSGELEKGIPM
jgi:hypothetical protein